MYPWTLRPCEQLLLLWQRVNTSSRALLPVPEGGPIPARREYEGADTLHPPATHGGGALPLLQYVHHVPPAMLLPELNERHLLRVGCGEWSKDPDLKREFPDLRFVNINGLAFKTLPFTRIQCPYRKHGAHCAFIKAHQLFDHYFAVD